ncbi:MAG: acyl--CoA ligase, partial [Candidatus Thiodiazotropha sp. (ex Lucinoma borealis)]|nr:acyl--CoA ligase [Candidatus Thiodiazotropha sp. (ex Lucinoma borealis)]
MPTTLFDHFETTVNKYPDSLAIADIKQRASYQDLFELVGKVSRYLLESGLKKGDRVSLVITNSVEYAAVFYGIWAIGGVTVALNTQAKAKDIINWVNHSEAHWLFIDERHQEFKAIAAEIKSDIELISVGRGASDYQTEAAVSWQQILDQTASEPNISLTPSDLASIIYTSGTTGHPKGVTLSHGNLSANIDSILSYLELTEQDSILNVLPFYYSYGNSILHTHLAVGGSLILENSLAYPHRVMEKMASEAV